MADTSSDEEEKRVASSRKVQRAKKRAEKREAARKEKLRQTALRNEARQAEEERKACELQAREEACAPWHAAAHEYLAFNNDTPRSIAQKTGVDVKDLLRLNQPMYAGLRMNAKLKAGTRIKLPSPPTKRYEMYAPDGLVASLARTATPPSGQEGNNRGRCCAG